MSRSSIALSILPFASVRSLSAIQRPVGFALAPMSRTNLNLVETVSSYTTEPGPSVQYGVSPFNRAAAFKPTASISASR